MTLTVRFYRRAIEKGIDPKKAELQAVKKIYPGDKKSSTTLNIWRKYGLWQRGGPVTAHFPLRLVAKPLSSVWGKCWATVRGFSRKVTAPFRGGPHLKRWGCYVRLGVLRSVPRASRASDIDTWLQSLSNSFFVRLSCWVFASSLCPSGDPDRNVCSQPQGESEPHHGSSDEPSGCWLLQFSTQSV